jgi:hypothetical protein
MSTLGYNRESDKLNGVTEEGHFVGEEGDMTNDENKNTNGGDESVMDRNDLKVFGSGVGRRGDPRMNRAVAARLANPNLSLLDALIEGGFTFPNGTDSSRNDVDSDNVHVAQRKNQLSRRLRHHKRKSENGKTDAVYLKDIYRNHDDYDYLDSAGYLSTYATNRPYGTFVNENPMDMVLVQRPSLLFGGGTVMPVHHQSYGNSYFTSPRRLTFNPGFNRWRMASYNQNVAQKSIMNQYSTLAAKRLSSPTKLIHPPPKKKVKQIGTPPQRNIEENSTPTKPMHAPPQRNIEENSTPTKPMHPPQTNVEENGAPTKPTHPPSQRSIEENGTEDNNKEKQDKQDNFSNDDRLVKIKHAVELFQIEKKGLVTRCLISAGIPANDVLHNQDVADEFEAMLKQKN